MMVWYVLLLILPELMSAATIVVSNSDNLFSIISSAQTGDQIQVEAGSYSGGIISVDGVEVTALDSSLFATNISSSVTLQCDDSTFSGFSFYGFNSNAAIDIRGSRNIVSNLHFREMGRVSTSKGTHDL